VRSELGNSFIVMFGLIKDIVTLSWYLVRSELGTDDDESHCAD
jgi:hypothetical protein